MSNTATERIMSVVRSARSQASSAERAFDRANDSIQRNASRSIDLFGGSASSRVADIARDARRACDDLYTAYQSLVQEVDSQCRPLLEDKPSLQAVKEVRDLIKWLNDESEIENNFTASLNGSSLGDVASARYVPSLSCKMIQRFWENKYDNWPGRAEELAAQRAAAEERRKREQAQARLREIQRQKEAEERRIAEQKLAEEKAVAKAHMDRVTAQCTEKVSQFRDALNTTVLARETSLRGQVQAELDQMEARRQEILAELPRLGIFRGKKKKALRQELELLTAKMRHLSDPILWQDEVSVIEKKAARAAADYDRKVQKYLKDRFPNAAKDKKSIASGKHEYSEDARTAAMPCPTAPHPDGVL